MEYKERKRLAFLGLPWTFTTYTIKEDKLSVDSGLFSRKTDDCYMYKIQDVTLKRSLGERLFRTGTLLCFTGDVSHPELELKHIKRSKEIKDYIFEASEQARMKRRTIHTNDISAGDLESDLGMM